MADNQPKKAYKTLPSLSMQDKVCVVTGAARGLGYEFCNAFLQSGCTSLAVLDLKHDETRDVADLFAKENALDGDKKIDAIGIACDVSSEESVQAAFATIKQRFGRVDAVVASAGIVDNYSALEQVA
ncbi:hypothetical protein CCMSSC00406_0003149 [Pleurotus cornucopiae]|uniref:Uncharacterized protein n=1 Tax=Pleurotus cornucopiae TaxID=5321 RepID=A0ACB7J7M5_PLECO|nr:hypothetical protein CCMSSC00406_0003149 [Pleurotus cornucopiae]